MDSDMPQSGRRTFKELLELFGDRLPTHAEQALRAGRVLLALATWPQVLGIIGGCMLTLILCLFVQPLYIRWIYIALALAYMVYILRIIPGLKARLVDSTAKSIGALVEHSNEVTLEAAELIRRRREAIGAGQKPDNPGWRVFYSLLLKIRRVLLAGGELALPFNDSSRPLLLVCIGLVAAWLPFIISAGGAKPGAGQLILHGIASLGTTLQAIMLLLVAVLGGRAAFILGFAKYLLECLNAATDRSSLP